MTNEHMPTCGLHVLSLLAALLHPVAALVAGGSLGKALGSSARPVVVHVWDPKPAELESYAIADVSEACRSAGAAAVLVAPELIKAMAEEQAPHQGSFPNALPVIADCALKDLVGSGEELCTGAKNLGASAIGIRYYDLDWPDAAALEEALKSTIATAEESGLGTILLAEFGADRDEGLEGSGGLASRVGAAAALTKAGEEGGAVALGCWDGSQKELERLRAAGFGGLILKNACDGDVARGARIKSPSLAATAVSNLVKAALSKGSKSVWAGAGSTSGGGKSQSMESYFDRSG